MMNKLGKMILDFFGEEQVYKGESMSLKTFRAYHASHSLKDYFPYESYEDGIYFNRSTLGFILESLPIMGFTEESHKQIAGLFQYILPENSNIQFLLVADPYIGGALSEWQKVREQSSEMLHKMAYYRAQAFKDLAHNESKNLSARFFRLILSVTLPHKENDKPLAQSLVEIRELKERLEETLKMVGLHPFEMTPEFLMSFIDDIFFAHLKTQDFTPFVPDYNILDPIRFQTPTRNTSVQVKRKGLIINEKEQYLRAYQVAKYPERWTQAQMGELIGSATQLLQQILFLSLFITGCIFQDKMS